MKPRATKTTYGQFKRSVLYFQVKNTDRMWQGCNDLEAQKEHFELDLLVCLMTGLASDVPKVCYRHDGQGFQENVTPANSSSVYEDCSISSKKTYVSLPKAAPARLWSPELMSVVNYRAIIRFEQRLKKLYHQSFDCTILCILCLLYQQFAYSLMSFHTALRIQVFSSYKIVNFGIPTTIYSCQILGLC